MKIFIGIILLVSVGLVVAVVLYGMKRTYKVEHGPNQTVFGAGTADATLLDGEYRGQVTGYTGSWQGKTFNKAENSGINRFWEQGTIINKYPFATYASKGLRDSGMDVITLDYNQPGNPWWLKFIVDEIVQVDPTTYLGKVHVRVAPRIVFSMGYFTLEKATPSL